MSRCSAYASLLLLSLPLSGCGSGGSPAPNGNSAPAPQQMRTDSSFADQYYVADLPCQTAVGAGALGAMSITEWRGSSTQPVSYPFQGAASSGALSNPGIAGMYYNFYQSASCGTLGVSDTCGAPAVRQAPEALQICNPSGSYPRTSVEGVALTSMAHISAAYNFYQTVPNKSAAMVRANVLILPSIETTSNANRAVSTDNLAYTPDFGGQPAFVVYPKGERAVTAGLWTGLNLWELQWGLAHEFGHHVFRTHTGISSVGDATTGLDAASPIHKFPASEVEAGTPRTVTTTDIWGSVNEGYADLFAFYTYGAKAGLVAGVDCFDANREVTAAAFATGEPKILTAEVLASFNSTTTATTTSCKQPNFQDIHAIGAIVAHAVDEIFSSATTVTGAADPALAKAQLLLAFAERLGATVGTLGQANLTFDALLKDAVLTIATTDGKVPTAACNSAKTAFPETAPAWFTVAGGLTCQ